jgi:hypothetical protein
MIVDETIKDEAVGKLLADPISRRVFYHFAQWGPESSETLDQYSGAWRLNLDKEAATAFKAHKDEYLGLLRSAIPAFTGASRPTSILTGKAQETVKDFAFHCDVSDLEMIPASMLGQVRNINNKYVITGDAATLTALRAHWKSDLPAKGNLFVDGVPPVADSVSRQAFSISRSEIQNDFESYRVKSAAAAKANQTVTIVED